MTSSDPIPGPGSPSAIDAARRAAGLAGPPARRSERLDAYLARRGHGTRSEVRLLIRRGLVRVDGQPCRDAARHIGDERVELAGTAVETGPEAATLLMHKPVGYACSHSRRETPLIEELYPALYRHLHLESAGRLDRDTSGLLVISSDGELIHTLTNPRKNLVKRYRIAYVGRLSSHAVQRCAKGMLLDGDPRPTRPAHLVLGGNDAEGRHTATLHLAEGRWRQVRRMIAELGGEVVALHRDRIGALPLPDDLRPGDCRELGERERELLLTTDTWPTV